MKFLGQLLKFSLFLILFVSFSAVSFAEYSKVFKISAYYSPLPCQSRYATGAYETDIRLNGRGTNGADGTQVYAGMIAAPKSYAFGTKMYIPGIGMTTVHDRGGAIVEAENYAGNYDRLDVWMGYGDKGLTRALAWGKRDVSVSVYGVDYSIPDNVEIYGYSEDEANYICDQQYVSESVAFVSNTSPSYTNNYSAPIINKPIVDSDLFYKALRKDDVDTDVYRLKEELLHLNYYKGELNSVYDNVTVHAVYKFQQSQGIIDTLDDVGAGYFGPSTRQRLNEIVSQRKENEKMIADANTNFASNIAMASNADVLVSNTNALISSELDFGDVSEDVTVLQEFLISNGVYKGTFTSNYFGELTKASLIDFQLKNGLIDSEFDFGAGRLGPNTLELINSMA